VRDGTRVESVVPSRIGMRDLRLVFRGRTWKRYHVRILPSREAGPRPRTALASHAAQAPWYHVLVTILMLYIGINVMVEKYLGSSLADRSRSGIRENSVD
jgi:hypothetical protein